MKVHQIKLALAHLTSVVMLFTKVEYIIFPKKVRTVSEKKYASIKMAKLFYNKCVFTLLTKEEL